MLKSIKNKISNVRKKKKTKDKDARINEKNANYEECRSDVSCINT